MGVAQSIARYKVSLRRLIRRRGLEVDPDWTTQDLEYFSIDRLGLCAYFQAGLFWAYDPEDVDCVLFESIDRDLLHTDRASTE
jgi:hypothetical protein